MPRLVRYPAYVFGLSLLYAATTLFVDSALQFIDHGHLLGETALAFFVTAVVTTPLAALQLAIGMCAVKGLSLRRFFRTSALFVVLGSAVLTLGDHVLPASILYVLGVFGGALVNPVLVLTAPLLVVVFARLRRFAAKPPRAVGRDPVSNSGWPYGQWCRIVRRKLWGRWYRWDIGLALPPLWFGVLFDPSGFLSYYGGLVNAPLAQGALCMSIMLVPAAVICLVVLVFRILFIWPRHLRSWPRTVLAWLVVASTSGFFFLLPSSDFPNQMDIFMSGFETHIRMRTDISAIQSWLETVDADNIDGRDAGWKLDRAARRLPAIARLHAPYVRLDRDEQGQPTVRFSWGTGVTGSWGLVVGTEDMETPPSDYSRYGEYRCQCAKGAYLWYELS